MPTGYIYEIKSMDTSVTGTYIGSTWDMKDRLRIHASSCYNENSKDYNYPIYKYIRENGGFHTFTMKFIDSGECEDEIELHCAEQFYIDIAGGVENLLNDRDALVDKELRKKKEYINKEKNKKKYYENTKEKQFTKYECECGGSYLYKHKSAHIKTTKHQNYIKK